MTSVFVTGGTGLIGSNICKQLIGMPGVSWFANLFEVVTKTLKTFIKAAQITLKPNLRSIVLFNSAAEGHLRPTSNVNMIVVLRALDATRADRLREPLRR